MLDACTDSTLCQQQHEEMAFVRSLKQLAPSVTGHLASIGPPGSLLCGVHQQLPSVLVSLTHLGLEQYRQQSSPQHFRQSAQHHTHSGAGFQHSACQGSDLHGTWKRSSCSHFSTSNNSADTSSDRPKYPVTTPDHVFTYSGPLAVTVSRLKRLSLFSCACTLAASPIIIYMSSATSFGAKASIAFTLCGFGLFTTGLMHWFTSPYVHQLTHNSMTGLTEVETLNFLAKRQRRTFSESEVQYPTTFRPQSTFQVHGQVYYIDADSFEDKELLAKLSPRDSVEVQPDGH